MNKGALVAWCQSDSGKRVMALEREMLSPIIDSYRPIRYLELSAYNLVSAKIRHKVCVGFTESSFEQKQERKNVIADPSKLPFASGYFDLVVCSHGHELSAHAGTVVQELSRVVMPEGLVVFLGLNPHGLWRTQDFPGVDQWWRCKVSQGDLQSLAQLSSLVEVYTDYKGFWHCGPHTSRWQIAATRTLAHYLPQTSVLVKTVFRKRVLAKTGVVYHDEAALSMLG